MKQHAIMMAMGLAAAVAARADFSRYDVILARQPFGTLTSSKGSPLEIPADSFFKDLRLCAISEDQSGIQVGIMNLKSSRSYYLAVGQKDEADGVEMLDADYELECARLKRDTEEYWIYMKEGQAGPPPEPGEASAVSAGGEGTVRRLSYVEKMRRRREEMRRQVLTPPVYAPPEGTPEEVQSHLEQYQMDLIRAGGEAGPPLPIPLTPAMDDQLVAEGVLPPQE